MIRQQRTARAVILSNCNKSPLSVYDTDEAYAEQVVVHFSEALSHYLDERDTRRQPAYNPYDIQSA